jgi:hypothetical protein
MIPRDAGEIFPEGGAKFVGNKVTTILRAENEMNEKVRVFVRHGAVPAGLAFYLRAFPGTAVPGFHMPPLRGWRSVNANATAEENCRIRLQNTAAECGHRTRLQNTKVHPEGI